MPHRKATFYARHDRLMTSLSIAPLSAECTPVLMTWFSSRSSASRPVALYSEWFVVLGPNGPCNSSIPWKVSLWHVVFRSLNRKKSHGLRSRLLGGEGAWREWQLGNHLPILAIDEVWNGQDALSALEDMQVAPWCAIWASRSYACRDSCERSTQ